MTSALILNKKRLSLYQLFMAAGIPGYLLFFRNIIHFLTARQRDLDDYAVIDNAAIFQIIFVFGVFLISSYILFKDPQKKRFLFAAPQIFLFIYIGICFLSMIWTPNIFVTGYRSFESLSYLLLISLVAYNLVSRIGGQGIIEWAALWIIWDIFWSIAINMKYSGFDVLFWPFKASRLAVPMLFFFAVLLIQRSSFKYIILTFCILSFSNKVFIGIALGFIGFFFGDSKYKSWLLLGILSVLVTLVFIDLEELLLNTVFYGRESVSMANMSGRDKIWTIAWEGFLQKPFIGYGFVDGENKVLYSRFQSGAINTHNFIFSGLLGTGIAGTLFLIFYFWSAFKTASSKYFPLNKWRPAMVSTFIMGLVISMSAPGLGGRVYGSWIPVVLLFTLISALHYKFKIISQIKSR